jgi:hypothetical protein
VDLKLMVDNVEFYDILFLEIESSCLKNARSFLMLHNSPELPQYVALALDRYRQLLEDARRYREIDAACNLNAARPMRWRRLRFRVGALLINLGQRLKGSATDVSSVTDVVWR